MVDSAPEGEGGGTSSRGGGWWIQLQRGRVVELAPDASLCVRSIVLFNQSVNLVDN